MSVCGLHSQILHLYFLASQQVHTFLVSLYVEEKKNSQWNSSFIDSSSTDHFENTKELKFLKLAFKELEFHLVWTLRKQSMLSAWPISMM